MRVVHTPAPVRIQAVEAIRDEIISGRLPAGARLIERDLTERLGVSRNTLREAYRQLEAEGFLDIRPHRGPVVASLEPTRAMELYEVREAIECMAVKLFTLRASQAQVTELEQAFTAFADAVRHADVANIVAVKDLFYDRLYAGAGNKELHAQARTMYGRLAGLRLQSLSSAGRPAESLTEIRQVIDTIASRDAVGAEELWREHIHHAASAALNALRDRQAPPARAVSEPAQN